MQKKIIIVGAGPVGCYCGQLLKKIGLDTLIIEEHPEVGKPLHCTGLVGNKVFEEKRIFPIPSSAIINTINGAVIHFEDQHFIIQRQKVAYVIDREKFDKELSKGLNILFRHRFLGIEKNKTDYIVEADKDEFSANIIIGADGANSLTRKILNPQTNHIKVYKGLQVRLETKPRFSDFVEVYLKRPYFFWLVPETKDIVRVGVISENPHKDLYDFLKKIKIKGKVIDRFGGLVSLGVCERTATDSIAIVGDAACQLKPITYGGVYFGLKAADILVSCLKENRLQDYDTLWKKKLIFEIKTGFKVRNLYSRLDNNEFRKIFNLLKANKLLIEKMADFENHSQLIFKILKNPQLYPKIGGLFSMLFKKLV